jgi:transposase-like protein
MKETGSPKMMTSPKEKVAEATERRPGERSEPGRSGGASAAKLATPDKSCLPVLVPNPEVLEKPIRRRFTAEYKLRILQEVDALSESGQIGALLRREGLYSSNLTTWRRQRDNGTIEALSPKKRGRKALRQEPLIQENEQLRRKNERLARRLKKAEAIIDFQKKISDILGIPLSQPESDENDL